MQKMASTTLFVLLLCVASVFSQTFDYQTPSALFVGRSFQVGLAVTSFPTASALTGSVFPQNGIYTASPSQYTYSTSEVGTHKVFTFTILSSQSSVVDLYFNFTDGTNTYNTDVSVAVGTRAFAFVQTTAATVIQVQSDAIVVDLNNFEYPDTGSVVLGLSASPSNAISLSATSLTFTPGARNMAFYYTVNSYQAGGITISATVTNTAGAAFTAMFTAPFTSLTITTLKRNFALAGSFNSVYFNQQSSSIRAYVDYLPPTGVALTLSAPNTTFLPSSTLSFTPTIGSVEFSYISSYPTVLTPYVVTFTTQGADSGIYNDFTTPYGVYATTAPIYITYPNSNLNLFVTQSTQTITVTLAVAAVNGLVLTPLPTTTFTYSFGSQLTFGPSDTSKTFTVSTSLAQTISASSIAFTVSGADTLLFQSTLTTTNSAAQSYHFNLISINTVLTSNTQYCGETSTYTVTSNFPAVNGFSIALSLVSSGSAIISPSVLNFAAGDSSKTFTVQELYGSPSVALAATGADFPLISSISPVSLSSNRKTVIVGAVYPANSNGYVYPGQTFGFPVSVDYVPVSDVTVAPKMNGVTFSPISFTFTPTANTVYFTAVAQTVPAAYSGSLVLSGTDAGCYDAPNSISYTVATITPQRYAANTNPYYNVPATINVQVPNLHQDLTVTVSAVDQDQRAYPAVFSSAALSFSQTATSQTFTVTLPSFANAVTLNFAISGNAAPYVDAIASVVLIPQQIQVVVPNFAGSAAPTFYPNTNSAAQTVALAAAPVNGLTVRLSSASDTLTFSSAILTFTPTGSLTQTFTFAQKLFSASETIQYELTGQDANMFALDTAGAMVNFQKIPIDNSVASSTTVTTVLNQPITFMLSTDVAPTDLSVVPAGPFTFNPAVISLSTSTAVKVTATPISVDSSGAITFTLLGADSSFYNAPTPITATVLKGTVTVGSSATLNANGLSSTVTVTTDVIPPTGLTITPYSGSATFSPAVTLSPSTPRASFTFTVSNSVAFQSVSSLWVGFVLSGIDAPNFNQIGEQQIILTSNTAQYTLTTTAASPYTVTVGATQSIGVRVSGITTSITVTPMSANANLVFSPASFTFTPSTPTSTVFSVTAQGYFYTGTSPIEWILSGADAALFSNPAQTIVQYNQPGVINSGFTPATPVVGTQAYATVTLDNAPLTALTVTLSTPQAGVTISPTTLPFSSTGPTTLSYTVTSSSVQTVTINLALSGTNVADFAQPGPVTVAFITGTILVNFPSSGNAVWQAVGVARTVSFSLNTPVVSALTITPQVDCLSFASPVTFAAGQTYQEVVATSVYYTRTATPVTYKLTGADAARYTVPPTVNVVVEQLQLITTKADTLYNDVELTVNVQTITSLYPSFDFGQLVVTPVAVGYFFTPASITLSKAQVSASFVASATGMLPATTLLYTVSGTGAALFNPATLSFTIPAFVRAPLVTSLTTIAAATVGAHFNGYVALSGAMGTAHTTLTSTGPSVTISLSSNINAVIEPSSVTINNTNTLVPFVFTPTQVYGGPVYIYYSVSGAGSTFFFTEGTVAQSNQITSVGKRTVSVVAPSSFSTNSRYIATYGQASDLFYVQTASPAYEITVTPISPYFVFTPAQLQFGNGVSSASFSLTPIKLGYGATIYYQISGPDAELFAATISTTINHIAPAITITKLPILTAFKASTVVNITLSPAPLDTYYITPAADSCQFIPPTIAFSPNTPTAGFQIVSSAISLYNPSSSNYNVIPGQQTYTSVGTQPLILTAYDAAGTSYPLPINPEFYDTYVNTAPGRFKLSHPRYQNDEPSHITVEIDELPRSDVSITFFGDNMEFDPPYVVFTHDGSYKQKVKVTPKHASTQDMHHVPSKIEYGCAGTDRDYYICPTQTQHFVAIQRGYVAAAVLLPLAFVAACVVGGFFLYRNRQKNPPKKANFELSSTA